MYFAHRAELRNRFQWVGPFASGAYREDEGKWRELVDLARYDWGAAWVPDTWPLVEAQMRTIVELCRSRHARLLCVGFPVSPQVEITAPFADLDLPQRRAAQVCAALGVPFLDLLPALREHRTEGLFADQCHPTVRANQVIAEAIAPWLAEQLGDGPEGRQPAAAAGP